MLIDVVFPGWIPLAEMAVSEDVPGWSNAHDQILEYEFDHYVGGHVSRTGARGDVLAQKEYLDDLMANCRDAIVSSAAIASEILGPTVLKNPGNGWASREDLCGNTAQVCADKTNEKWVGRLGAADVFGFEKCV